MSTPAQTGITVAMTGATGGIGRALLRALEREPAVERVVGMARREFDPHRHGLTKLEYRRGDVTDRRAVDELVAGADVVVHLAFLVFGDHDETHRINIGGSRNVFEAALATGAERLVYVSSVAAYGFCDDNPDVLTEDVPARGTKGHYYSAQKASVEEMLRRLAATSTTDVYVFRPCTVGGPGSLELIDKIPFLSWTDKVPDAVVKLVGAVPLLRPVIPDPGFPFQIVHEDDVASALASGVVGDGPPGTYNLAADGDISFADLARGLGWYSVPVPAIAIGTTARIVSRLPLLPASTEWINAVRVPVLMDTSKAKRDLGWVPKNDALETLSQTVHAARRQGILAARFASRSTVPSR